MTKEEILKKYLNKLGNLNSNEIRKMPETDASLIRELSNVKTAPITTALYCLDKGIECKKCVVCDKELDTENFNIGWHSKRMFCDKVCKAKYQPSMSKSTVILDDFTKLLDINGNPAREKMLKHLNPNSIAHLKSLVGLETDDITTLLYHHINKDKIAKTCIECDKVLEIDNFKMGYRDNQTTCSYACKDINSVYRDILGVGKRGVSRWENEKYVDTKTKWFDSKLERIKEKFEVDILTTFEEYRKDKRNINFKCCNCSHEYVNDFKYNRNLFCKMCYPASKEQSEIAKFVNDLGYDVDIDNRRILTPYEIDIFVKDKNIGIEYDGFYWHHDKDNSAKYKTANNLGIRLIKVFEDEYEFSPEIVKSRIAHVLGKHERKVFARKCTVREITFSDAKEFLIKNHIQGSVPSSSQYGLFLDDELISCMTFGKSRYSTKYDYELLRFASKLNCSVVGGASKLFKQFVRSNESVNIISYCDLRYGVGKVYEKLGFRYSHQSEPNYFYYKDGKRYSRIKFQKHKLEGLIEDFDPALSESVNMENNGYMKIFDLGNRVYTFQAVL